jgi:hypothetical protein
MQSGLMELPRIRLSLGIFQKNLIKEDILRVLRNFFLTRFAADYFSNEVYKRKHFPMKCVG